MPVTIETEITEAQIIRRLRDQLRTAVLAIQTKNKRTMEFVANNSEDILKLAEKFI